MGRLARFSLPGFGGAGGPFAGSLEDGMTHGAEEAAFCGANLLSRFFLDSS